MRGGYSVRVRVLALGTLACVLSSCGSTPTTAHAPVRVRIDFSRPDFYAAPFPSNDLLTADGHVDLSKFPNPSQNLFVGQLTKLLARDASSFATTGGVFFTLTDDIDPSTLPDLAGSMDPNASVRLVSLADGKQIPVWVSFTSDGGDYGGRHMLSIVPLAGIALQPKTKVAAIVTRNVRDTRGAMLDAISVTGASSAEYLQTLTSLKNAGVDLAGLAVFTTGDPTAQTLAVGADVTKRPLPTPMPFTIGDVFPTYCVFNSQIAMPDYQSGTPPFSSSGGDWAFDGSGKIIEQRKELASIVVTIPRAPMPTNGYPLTVMVRTGGGGDRPLVDRGVQAVHDGPPIVAGSGPAMEFAKVGFAGAQVDGPHGGLRNVTHDDEQFLMFNVNNGTAIRDNVRESALELAVFEKVLENVTIDASACQGASSSARFDATRTALLGHSMGATISPLVLALDSTFKAAILSGAGASWLENLVFKEKPVPLRPLIELLLGYSSSHRMLVRGDPVATLVQWALEPADPWVYGRLLGNTQLLMEQGIVDHYILPPIANATPLSAGLDLAGTELDTTNAELMARPELYTFSSVMKYADKKVLPFPVTANAGPGITRVVVQHPADGIEDGHEVMFQTEPPKREYRCFLQSFAKGGAALVPDGNVDAACP